DGDELATQVDELDPVPFGRLEFAHQDRLAVGDAVLLLRVGGDLGEGERDVVEGDPAGPGRPFRREAGLEAADGHRIVDAERSDLEAPQRGEMSAATQLAP